MEFFLKEEVNQTDYYWSVYLGYIRKIIYKYRWYLVYDFLEFLVRHFQPYNQTLHDEFEKQCNLVFERESVGYKLVDKKILPIASKHEVKEVN